MSVKGNHWPGAFPDGRKVDHLRHVREWEHLLALQREIADAYVQALGRAGTAPNTVKGLRLF